MPDEPMVETLICRRWPVLLPESRAQRPGWDYWEIERLSLMWAAIRPGDVVWEIGAEIGDLAALYALWGADVVLVEPDPNCWPTIEAVFAANGVTERIVGRFQENIDASVWLLDAMLVPFPKPNVVSIDIEGDEYQALLGAGALLTEVKPILFISVHPDFLWDKHKDTPDDVWMHLELHGYEVERLGRDHEIHIVAKPKP